MDNFMYAVTLLSENKSAVLPQSCIYSLENLNPKGLPLKSRYSAEFDLLTNQLVQFGPQIALYHSSQPPIGAIPNGCPLAVTSYTKEFKVATLLYTSLDTTDPVNTGFQIEQNVLHASVSLES